MRARQLRDEFFTAVQDDGPNDPDGFDASWITGDHLPAILGIAIANGMKLEARVEELELQIAALQGSGD